MAEEIWRQAGEAGLSPFDRLTFEAAGVDDIVGRVRFQVVTVDPVVVRPWIDFVLVPVERAYYGLLGTAPPEIFTTTLGAAVGRLRDVGIHVPADRGAGTVRDSIARHIEAFFQILSEASPAYLVDDLLRQQRFGGETHSRWRLPLALAVYGRSREARAAFEALAGERPYSRDFNEAHWLAERFDSRSGEVWQR